MMLRNTRESWGVIARSLHWLIAGFILVQFVLGPIAEDWRLSPTKLDLFVWHKSIGILILLLVILRITWRLLNPTPSLPADLSSFHRRMAQLSHGLLYLFMFLIPISGWLINSAANIPFKVFWLFPLPDLVGADKELKELAVRLHLYLVIGLGSLLFLHIGAALHHHFGKRNDILLRMLRNSRKEP